MKKQRILVGAWALIALAFTASPSLASAGEPLTHCTSLPCNFVVQSTGHTIFSTAPKAGSTHTITCSSTTGSGSQSALTSTTQVVQLKFHGCKELDTGFGFSCKTPGEPSGTVTTNVLTSHNVWIDAEKKTPGVILTGMNITFSCAGGFSVSRSTGNVIGELESTVQCNVAINHNTIQFNDTGVHGQQAQTTVTGAGNFDLSVDIGETGEYVTKALRATAHLNWNQSVTTTC